MGLYPYFKKFTNHMPTCLLKPVDGKFITMYGKLDLSSGSTVICLHSRRYVFPLLISKDIFLRPNVFLPYGVFNTKNVVVKGVTWCQ